MNTITNNLPMVIIVGRTNVGKSTLFNRLSVKAESITLDQEGVTRDFIKDVISWNGRNFELIDTSGMTTQSNDPIMEKVRTNVLTWLDKADVILFVIDGAVGLLPEDRELARLLRSYGKKVFLIVNKSDRRETADNMAELEQLGFKHTFALSAQHAKGIGDLLEALVEDMAIAQAPKEEKRICKTVLLGKPNVGKSSLMNLLLNEERSIVHDVAGTTREAIGEKINFYKAEIQITDTAGVQLKQILMKSLDLNRKSSFKAVQDADIVLVLVDSSDGKLADQEIKLIWYALDNFKAVLLLFNKQDLMEPSVEDNLKYSLEENQRIMNKVPHLDISCKTGKNIGKILPMIQTLWERYTQQFSDNDLSFLCKDALLHKPLYHQTKLLRLFKVKQVRNAPITLLMIVNEVSWFGQSQLAFFEGILRKKYDLQGIPINFIVRKKG